MIRRASLAAFAALLLTTSAVSAATTTVAVLKTVQIYNSGYSPMALKIAVGDTVAWHNASHRNHCMTENVPAVWPVVEDVTIVPDHGFSFPMPNAGTFAYHCSIGPSMKGKILVKMSASPASGNTATNFTITVGSADAAPGHAEDIQYRKGGAPFTDFISVASKTVTWNPNNNDAGTWQFRTRYRNTSTNEHSGWSPVVTVTVH